MKLTRILTDTEGETRFDDLDIPFSETNFIEGAQPIGVAGPWAAERVSMVKVPPCWSDPQHPTPVRQLAVFLSGVAEMTTSDGETRVFEKGDAVMLEDVDGKGHGTRFVNDEDSLVVLIRLGPVDK